MAIDTQDWRRTPYREAFARQLALVQARIDGEVPDTLVFTEHDPVYTVGRRRDAIQHLLLNEETRAARGIDLVETTRGGDITYHGPGQLVGYPVVSLEQIRDLHRYLRDLEQVLINTLGVAGLAASRREGLTGIWLGPRKIAAIGVAVKRWVSYHGFALNVAPDLTAFDGIVPCGIGPNEGSVTSLATELGDLCPPMDELKAIVAAEFRKVFDA